MYGSYLFTEQRLLQDESFAGKPRISNVTCICVTIDGVWIAEWIIYIYIYTYEDMKTSQNGSR
jgi:hypothetical protein